MPRGITKTVNLMAKSKLQSAGKAKYKELIEQTMYEFRTGKLLSYEGEAVHTEKDAMSVAIDRAKKATED